MVLTALGGAVLYDVYGPLPFWIAAGLAIVILFLTWTWIREPEELASAQELAGEPFNLRGVVSFLRGLPKEHARSLIFLLLSNFLAYIALAQMQAFLSSYGVFSLGMEVSAAAMLVAHPGCGVYGHGHPRRIDCQDAMMLNIGLLICGLTWPLANVVQVAMIVDSAPVETLMGTYTGLRQIAVTLGFIVGPILGGTLVEAMGNNYRWVWMIMFVFLVLSTVAIIPVTKGEAKIELA